MLVGFMEGGNCHVLYRGPDDKAVFATSGAPRQEPFRRLLVHVRLAACSCCKGIGNMCEAQPGSQPLCYILVSTPVI